VRVLDQQVKVHVRRHWRLAQAGLEDLQPGHKTTQQGMLSITS
jgi:hypothetical protein